jgi:hypothetical protein
MADPQENAIGIPIVYEVQDKDGNPRDISSFTTHELVFQKPNKTVVVKPAVFFTDGTDGLLVYITVDGDLIPAGSFQVQAHLKNVTLEEYTGVDLFHCAKNLPR